MMPPRRISAVPLIPGKIRGESTKPPVALAGWFTNVTIGISITILVLSVNLIVLIWVAATQNVQNGSATVYEGSCSESKRVTFWCDLAINILSTLLLGASNNATQLLMAPSRRDVNNAHARGGWLDIGVPSLRNLSHMSRWRKSLCAVLLLSSIPLHLLYNSVLFSTLSASNYMAAVVTEDFLNGTSWNSSRIPHITESVGNVTKFLDQLQHNAGNLTRLENAECIEKYGTSQLESEWGNVLVVATSTNQTNQTESLIRPYFHHAEADYNDLGWICGHQNTYSSETNTCDPTDILSYADDWTIIDYPISSWYNQTDELTFEGSEYSSVSSKIGYCLAEPTEQRCTIKMSTTMLAVVVTCNFCKVACLAMILMARRFHPLATVGDLISSYIKEPDVFSRNKGPISISDVHRESGGNKKLWISNLRPSEISTFLLTQYPDTDSQGRPSTTTDDNLSGSKPVPRAWKNSSHRWFSSVTLRRRIICISLCSVTWFIGLGMLVNAIYHYKEDKGSTYTMSKIWSDGVGSVTTQNLVYPNTSIPLLGNVLLANTPQLIISMVYVFYNNIMTSMLLSHEYTSYARHRKPLRVSNPSGQQRSTYRLQLPYRYSVPLMTSVAVLHWLVARSIFLVQISVYDYTGALNEDYTINSCGYSAMGIVLTLIVSGVIILGLVGNGFRRLDGGVPLAGSCSFAIAAACHADMEAGAEDKPLMYGVVEMADGVGEEEACGRVGFSAGEVTPLVDGRMYV